jgi:hypothetical protein
MIGRYLLLGPRVPLGEKVLPAATILLAFWFFFSVAEMVDGGQLSSIILPLVLNQVYDEVLYNIVGIILVHLLHVANNIEVLFICHVQAFQVTAWEWGITCKMQTEQSHMSRPNPQPYTSQIGIPQQRKRIT